MNELFFDLSSNIRFWQTFGIYDFITTAMNNGAPYSYDQEARVLYSGNVYRSLVSANTFIPNDPTKWVLEEKGFIAQLVTAGQQGKYLRVKADLSGYELTTPPVGRNIIMNGDFAISQRGTSFAPVVNVDWTIDRWAWSEVIDGGVKSGHAVNQVLFDRGQVDVPNNPTYHMDVSGNIAGGAGFEQLGMIHMAEDVSQFSGENCVLSFWVKGSVAGQFYLNAQQVFGYGGGFSPQVNIDDIDQMIPVITDWIKITLPVSMPSIVGKNINPNQNFIQLSAVWQMGAARAAQAPNAVANAYGGVLSFADVQLEKGTVATEYDRLEIGIQFKQCQRFFQIMDFDSIAALIFRCQASAILHSQNFPFAAMRKAPTCSTQYGLGLLSFLNLSANGDLGGTFPFNFIAGSNNMLRVESASGGTDGEFYGSVFLGGGGAWLDAEMVVNG